MKTLLLFALTIGLVLNSPCTDVTPQKSDDCLKVYSKDNICCMYEHTVGDKKTVSCVEKDIAFSAKNEYEQTVFKNVKTVKSLTCSIKVEFCGGITAEEANECLDSKIPNGLCCFDKKQGVCFSYPFHFKSEEITCERTEEKPKPKPKFPWSDW